MNIPVRALSLGIVASIILCTPLQAQISDNPQPPDNPETRRIEIADRLVDTSNAWLRWYGELPPRWRRVFERYAVAVAGFRRPVLEYLIVQSPERALEDRLGRADRVMLSDKVTALLETQIDGYGRYRAEGYLHFSDPQTGEFISEEQLGSLTIGNLTFASPSIYGGRIFQRSADKIPVHGIALDSAFAWSEAPYRLLDAVELEERQVPIDHIGILSGDDLKIVAIDDDDAIRALLISLLSDEIRYSLITNLLRYLWTNGDKRLLWLPVDFPEARGSRFTESARTNAMIADANEWLAAISREQTSIVPTYFPGVLRLSSDTLARTAIHPSAVLDEIAPALEAYDAANGGTGEWLVSSWDRVAVVVGNAITSSDGAVATGSWTDVFEPRYMYFYGQPDMFSWMLKHELGHSYLFSHSFYLGSHTADLGSRAATLWDFMGHASSNDNRQHPIAYFKDRARWFDAAEVANDTSGGSYRIVAHDNGPSGSVRAIRIVTDDREYWVDMRRLWPEAPVLHQGVQIHFAALGVSDHSYLFGPRPDAGIAQSPFVAGELFEDTGRGVRVHVDATGMDGSTHFADVTVERF